ncbi:MAG: PilT/PilU family type 4a pilus ATPase [Elusimicrobiota bacterium]|nr:PilT/PilU family type 4a pilus ATPase [Endomicrobiia bacterium]MCX7910488.1 PilT/PilU family type 4a pilus ATPase [Endomicrobiia bacterium]MDW8166012.1 PilT/PilU family type 4a pilus ATPase [Elusimicrobiota bacterium]
MSGIDKIIKIIRKFIELGGSDLHLRSNSVPYVRKNGVLMVLDNEYLVSYEEIKNFAYYVMNEEQQRRFEIEKECDVGYNFENISRLRMNIFYQKGMINIAIRHIPLEIPNREILNLPEIVYKLADNIRGLVLVTGPAGSGKSTTLASMIDYINSTRSAHIVTIEDPIEFIHKDKKSIISQREVPYDTLSFISALRHVVRQNPDVILIGEMRDLETMQAALTAAQLGHFVLSTVHTVDTIQTINRIIDIFPPHQQNQIRLQLADTLKGVISQRLIRKKDGSGLIPAVEVLVVTPAVRKCIEEKNFGDLYNLLKQGKHYGMQTFNQALLDLFRKEKISLEDALQAATSPEELMLAIKGIETSSIESSQIYERFERR